MSQVPAHEISQARILEWVAFPSPGDLPYPAIKPMSPALQVDSYCRVTSEAQCNDWHHREPLYVLLFQIRQESPIIKLGQFSNFNGDLWDDIIC